MASRIAILTLPVLATKIIVHTNKMSYLYPSMEKKSDYCTCLFYTANALARNMTRLAEEAFANTGLAPSYAFLLMSINKYPGLQAGELAEIMMLSPSTITRLVEKLEKKGLVKRVSEGRSTLLFPTAESVGLNQQIKASWAELYQKYAAILGNDAAKELTAQTYNAALNLEKK